jgi:hypothetical protein
MSNTNSILVASLLFMALLLSALPTLAFQVGPAAKRLTYAPGTIETYTLRVINDGSAALNVNITPIGPLDASVAPSQFTMSPDEAERTVTVTLREPANASLLTPGDNLETITLTATPSGGGGQFGGAVTLLHNLVLLRPYEGAYVVGSLSAAGPPAGTPIMITLSLVNKGNAATRVTGSAAVLTPAGEEMGSIGLGEVEIAGASESKLQQAWSPATPLQPGSYLANATIAYNDLTTGRTTRSYAAQFRVGRASALVDVPSITLTPGAIARLPITVQLAWNEPIAGLADVRLQDASGALLSSSRTPTTTLTPGTTTPLDAFIEVPQLGAGDYSIHVTLLDAATGEELGSAIAAARVAGVVAPVPRPSWVTTSILVIAALILVGILTLFLLWRRRERGP